MNELLNGFALTVCITKSPDLYFYYPAHLLYGAKLLSCTCLCSPQCKEDPGPLLIHCLPPSSRAEVSTGRIVRLMQLNKGIQQAVSCSAIRQRASDIAIQIEPQCRCPTKCWCVSYLRQTTAATQPETKKSIRMQKSGATADHNLHPAFAGLILSALVQIHSPPRIPLHKNTPGGG